jgi:subtilisin-like proprotein convertase family protein/endonuclease/exonuclease/phosphatase family metal-dependent hydrolase
MTRIWPVVFCSVILASVEVWADGLVFRDAGLPRAFEVALDQVAVSGADRRRELIDVPPARTARDLQTRSVATAAVGETIELVLYATEDGRRVGVPRVVTRGVLFQVVADANPSKVALAAGAVDAEAAGYGYWRAVAADSAAALDLVAALQADSRVTYAEPLLARQQQKRFTPNDPLFADQWHLRNTGQSGGVVGMDVRVTNVWAQNLFGRDVHIAIVDDGLQENHPDLSANVVPSLSYDINYNDGDPSPDLAADNHGTACAGVAAARGDNGLGVSGSAPLARLVGLRLISAGTTDAEEAAAMAWSNAVIEISSNSWGPNDDGETLEGPGPLTAAAFADATTNGRNGLGTLFFWAGGNGLQNNDNANYDGYANSIYTISITAVDPRGRQSWYAEPGANHIAAASSEGLNNSSANVGVTTVDRTGNAGYSNTDYADDFGGTSSACPLAAGVGALLLEANPNLGWRDMQEILLTTATRNHPTDAGWRQNGAGIWVNHKYGGGLINADAAVAAALSWTNLGAQVVESVAQTGLNVGIPDNNAVGVTRTFTVTEPMRLEHVVMTLDISHARRRHLLIELVSPMGTTSTLATVEAASTAGANFRDWPLMSVQHWGESSVGEWTLRVSDRASGTAGTLNDATLTLYGTAATLEPDQPPVLTVEAVGEVVLGDPVSLAVSASDVVDGDVITLTASNLPAGASFSVTNGAGSSAGTFTWPEAGPVGEYAVVFQASDKDGAVQVSRTIRVIAEPVLVGYTNSAAITIRDNATASPYPAVITVSEDRVIKRVVPTLRGLSHTWPADLNVVLVGPDGTTAGLLGGSGSGNNVSGIDLTFDDQALSTVGGTLTTGTWRPSGSISDSLPVPAPGGAYPMTLTNFAGRVAAGDWSLYMEDTVGGDSGSMANGWSLVLELEGDTNDPPAESSYGMRDDGGVNLPTLTYWHDGLGADVTQQGAAFAQDFGERSAFYLKDASIQVWKNADAGGDVTGTRFHYKLWEQGTAEPAYTVRSVGWSSDDGAGNQVWSDFGSEINLLSGRSAGNYNLKVLFDVEGSGEPGILTNGPFTATLSVAPAAVSGSASFGATRVIGEEGQGALLVPVVLSASVDAEVQIQFSGTVEHGVDLIGPTSLVFSAGGPVSNAFVFSVVDDALAEGPETARMTLQAVSGVSNGVTTTAQLVLRDNDAFSVVAANLTSISSRYDVHGARILQALSPDVVLLQEAKKADGDFIDQAWVDDVFGEGFSFFVEPESAGSIPTALISRWPMVDTGEWEDSTVPNRDFSRATIQLPGPRLLHAVSLHLYGDNAPDRTLAARALTNYVATSGWSMDDYVVVGGDLNLRNRSESALNVLKNVFSDAWRPEDQQGNENTNEPRNRPYDYVLPNPALDARHQTISFWGETFPFGLVFDTRLNWPDGIPYPAQFGDSSSDVFMQHMAVVKVFALEGVSSGPQDQTITFVAIADQVTTNLVNLSATASSGLPVSFEVASGPATLTGGTQLSFSGTGEVSVVASQAGNTNWNAAVPVTNQFVVSEPIVPLGVPANVRVVRTNGYRFAAAWDAVTEAETYRLDVSRSPTFAGSAAVEELFISEYVEGSSNNKAIELFNGTGAAVDLTAGGYVLKIYYNGSASPLSLIDLSGTVADGDVYVVANSSANATILSEADQTSGSLTFNGNDVVELVVNGERIDVMGTIGSGAIFAENITKVRQSGVTAGVQTYDSAEWDDFGEDTTDDLGRHSVTSAVSVEAFVAGYADRLVEGTDTVVTNLQPGETYYFRVRAVGGGQTSANSTTGSVVTLVLVTNAPVAVPQGWLAENFPEVDTNEYAVLVTNTAANGILSVWESYVAGLDPADPDSVLQVDSQPMPPSGQELGMVVLEWSSAPDRIYHVGWKTNLFEPFVWTNVPATPPVNSFTSAPPAAGVFYRIGVSLEP